MVLLESSEEWQRQSALLLQARPTTTRITTKYNIPNLESAKYKIVKKRKHEEGTDEKDASAGLKAPRATLTLKTHDTETGVVLKFKTDRAADVGRLINGLGRLGRLMAALPVQDDVQDAAMEDATGPSSEAAQAVKSSTAPDTSDAKQAVAGATPAAGSGGGGGGKKKKKGKK